MSASFDFDTGAGVVAFVVGNNGDDDRVGSADDAGAGCRDEDEVDLVCSLARGFGMSIFGISRTIECSLSSLDFLLLNETNENS